MRRDGASRPESAARKVVDIFKNVSQDKNNLDLLIEDDSQANVGHPEEMMVPQASVEVKASTPFRLSKNNTLTAN